LEKIVTTKRGSFGFVRVAIPKTVKELMLKWCNKSGLGKAEFFRVSLIMGAVQLAEQVKAKSHDEDSHEKTSLVVNLR